MPISILSTPFGTGSNTTATTTLVPSIVSGGMTAGQTVAVAVAIATTTASVSSITDNIGNTYTQRSFVQNASGVRTELWTATVGTGNVNALTITASTAVLMAASVTTYSGVISFGNTETATDTSLVPVASLTTQDSGNWNIAAFGFVCASGDSITQIFGTKERYVVPALTSVGCALVDVSQTGPGFSPLQALLSASRAWAVAGVELRTTVTFGAFVDTPETSTNMPLGVASQVGSVMHYLEPPFNANGQGGSSSGAVFF
jgi:hypothetical protein